MMTELAEALPADHSQSHANMDLLTKQSLERVEEIFEEREHKPSWKMRQGLFNLQGTLTSMLQGKAEEKYYLSSLDPGVGKTTAICKWLEVYLDNIETYGRHGILIGLERLEEIHAFVSDAKLPEDSYAVLVSDKTDGGKELNSKGLGTDRIDDALILFTTKAQLRLRTEGKLFSEVTSLFYLGQPRIVRIWDESLIVGKPLTLSRGQIAKLVDVLDRNGHHIFSSEILELSTRLADMKDDGEAFEMPELKITPSQFSWCFQSAPKIEQEISEVFAVMAGRVVTVRTGNSSGGTLVDCEDSLPVDFAPCLITDASGRIRETYKLQHKYQEDVIPLAPSGSVKKYDNLTVHIWSRGSGKSWYKNNGTESTSHEVAKVIKSRPDEQFLVIHFKDFGLDKAIGMKLDNKDKDRVKYLTLGKHTATNDYHDIPNVIITGMLNYGTAACEALARASASRTTEDGPMGDYEVERMVRAEAAHHVLQAACRGRVRKSIGDLCPESRLWFIDSSYTKVGDLLPKLFPGCKRTVWKTERRPLTGQRQKALKLILEAVESGEKEIPASRIRDSLKMTSPNFKSCIISNDHFRDALAEHSIEPTFRSNRWWFVVQHCEYPFQDETLEEE